MVLLCDKNQRCCPIDWRSARLKRVVRSALGAETLALCDGSELAFSIAESLSKILNRPRIPVIALTDSQSLFETLGSTTQPTNHRLKLEINALREMVEEDDIRVKLVKGAKQISDPLTKRGAAWNLLQGVLQCGKLPSQ